MKNYKAELYEIRAGKELKVVQVDCPTIEQAEREIQHYALMYGQDCIVEIRRYYKLGPKTKEGEK